MPEYNIKLHLTKKLIFFLCPKYHDDISATKMNGIDLLKSCFSGVWTSCASMILEGSVEQKNVIGLNINMTQKSFALLCVVYPPSNFHVVVGDQVEDNLYNNQFGKYQK